MNLLRDRMASIIVPWWNQLPFTRLCLQILFRHTWRDFALEGLWGPPTEGSSTVRRSVITGSVALSLINNGTIVTHQVDPPDRVDQSSVRNWSRSITPVSRRPDTGVIGCG